MLTEVACSVRIGGLLVSFFCAISWFGSFQIETRFGGNKSPH